MPNKSYEFLKDNLTPEIVGNLSEYLQLFGKDVHDLTNIPNSFSMGYYFSFDDCDEEYDRYNGCIFVEEWHEDFVEYLTQATQEKDDAEIHEEMLDDILDIAQNADPEQDEALLFWGEYAMKTLRKNGWLD